MRFEILLLSVFAGCVSAAAVKGYGEKRCGCMNPIFSTTMLFTSATAGGSSEPQLAEETILFDYDLTSKRQRSLMKEQNITVYQDYKEKQMYIVLPDGSCNKEALTGTMYANCIPANFTYGGPNVIGQGAHAMTLTFYTGEMDGIHQVYGLNEDCNIVTAQWSGGDKTGKKFLYTYLYTDLKNSLRTPDVLNIPNICKKTVL